MILIRWSEKKKEIKQNGKKILSVPGILWRWLFVSIFRWHYYDSKYFRSKWFSSINEWGWRWAYRDIWNRLIFNIHKEIRWPVAPTVDCGKNIFFDIDDLNNFASGGSGYFQTFDAKIVIGKGTWIARNVGIITSNHDLVNPHLHQKGEDVIVGKQCWIGMNSVILPGVILGDHTVVGSGSIVTKSFPEGYCVIAGNPAKVIKKLSFDEVKKG